MFQSKPIQIRALIKALGVTPKDFSAQMGYKSNRVKQWMYGIGPGPPTLAKKEMMLFVDAFQVQYIRMLKKLEKEERKAKREAVAKATAKRA